MKIWTWDAETINWDEPRCVVAVSEDGDVEQFVGPDAFRGMARLIKSAGPAHWCAHAGGRFDFPLLMQYARDIIEFRRLIITSATVLCAERNQKTKLRDTYPLTLASLRKIGKWVGSKKMDIDRAKMELLTDHETVEYCESDCDILLRAVLQIRAFIEEQGASQAWTAGGVAVSLLRALEPAGWGAMAQNKVQFDDARRTLPVPGGRVEAWARGHIPEVFSYDFKSSYPARYARTPISLGCGEAATWVCDEVSRGVHHPGLWNASWTWPWRHRTPPRLDERTGAGFGRCSARLITEEVAAFQSVGVHVTVESGWIPRMEQAHIGGAFVDTMFAEKANGVPWAKVFLNSLHGKLGEKPVRESWTADYPTSWVGDAPPRFMSVDPNDEDSAGFWRYESLAIDKNGFCAPHVHPIAAAQVLGRARVALWQVIWTLQDEGWEVYYCDTDSVHTNAPPHVVEALVGLGSSLGALELEAEDCEGYYLGPKSYLLINRTTGEVVKSALKGAPLNSLAKGVKEDGRGNARALFRQARGQEKGTDLRRDLFREALDPQRAGVDILKEGIATFKTGLPAGDWGRKYQRRKITPTGRGKYWPHGTDKPAYWLYLSRDEVTTQTPPGEEEDWYYEQSDFVF